MKFKNCSEKLHVRPVLLACRTVRRYIRDGMGVKRLRGPGVDSWMNK